VTALRSRGLQELRGIRPTHQFVGRLTGLHLPFYAGIVRNPWTGDAVRGKHEAMITEDEMRLVQDRRVRRTWRLDRDRQSAAFPLRRVVLCSACLRGLSGSVARGNGGTTATTTASTETAFDIGRTLPKPS